MWIILAFIWGIIAAYWLVALVIAIQIFKAFRARRFGIQFKFILWAFCWFGFGLFLGLAPGSTRVEMYGQSTFLFGKRFWIGTPIMSYHSERHFNGDGYSITVHPIPDQLVAFLDSPPSEFMTHYPLKRSFRSNWEIVHWQRTPVPAGDRYLDFAGLAGVGPANDLFERLAHQPNNWYAYCFQANGDDVANVDYWLVCPKEKVLEPVSKPVCRPFKRVAAGWSFSTTV